MKEILEYYKNIKGDALNGWEVFNISKHFIPTMFPIKDWEKDYNNTVMLEAIDNIKNNPNKLPTLEWFQIKPITQKSIKDIYYQALLDYKNNNCSLETVNYIEKYL